METYCKYTKLFEFLWQYCYGFKYFLSAELPQIEYGASPSGGKGLAADAFEAAEHGRTEIIASAVEEQESFDRIDSPEPAAVAGVVPFGDQVAVQFHIAEPQLAALGNDKLIHLILFSISVNRGIIRPSRSIFSKNMVSGRTQ